MADLKISALPAATTPLAGSEVLPIVQSSTTRQVSVANLTAGRAVSVAGLTSTSNVTLSTNATYFRGVTSGAATTRMLGINSANTVYMGSIDTQAAGGVIFINGTEFMNVDLSNNVTFSAGNLVQGTAAKGINFTANTPAAGMTSQLLNWYEEGTFTPTIGGDSVAGVQTYNTQVGFYTRFGNRVEFNLRIVLTAKDAATAGNLIVGGLPFTSNNTVSNFHAVAVGNAGFFTLTSLYTQLEAHIERGLNYAYLGQIGSGLAYSYLQASAFAANSRINLSGHYMI
jgi:hypothetical protein